MALHLSFEDEDDEPPEEGALWRICQEDSRHRVRVRWTELQSDNLPEPETIHYHFRVVSWFFLLPVDTKGGTMRRSGRPREWVDDREVTGGRLLTRYIEVRVPGRDDPPNRGRLWLIPRRSVIASVTMLVLLLVGVAVQMATTLATLHVKLTYQHAVTGLGALTVLALVVMILRAIVPKLRGHRPPSLGLGYMIGRTLATCLVAGVVLAVLPRQLLTRLVNRTDATVEVRLPDSPAPVVLGKGHSVTFFGRPSRVRETIAGSLEDRFCAASVEDEAPGCADPGGDERAEAEIGHWLLAGLRPRLMGVRCRVQRWEGLELGPERAARLFSDAGATRTLYGKDLADEQSLRLVLDGSCQRPARPRMDVTVAAEDGRWSIEYRGVHYPWRLDALDESVKLQVAEVGTKTVLWTSTAARDPGAAAASPDPGEGSSEGDGGGRPTEGASDAEADPGTPASRVEPVEVVIDVEGETPPLPTAHPRGTSRIDLAILDEGSGREASIACTAKDVVGDGAARRLEPIAVAGKGSSWLRTLSFDAPKWRSQWTREGKGGGPWLCAVVAGGEPLGVPNPEGVTLTLGVVRPSDEPRAIRLPAEYVPTVIEVVRTVGGDASEGREEVEIGELACDLHHRVSAYEIGPVWIEDPREQAVEGLTLIGPETEGSWRSRWEATGAQELLEPAWVCRPVMEQGQWCGLGCTGTKRRIAAEVDLRGPGRPRDGSLALADGTVSLGRPRPTVCYFEASEGRFVRSYRRSPCVRSKRCPGDYSREVEDVNRALGESCTQLVVCKASGEDDRCP